MPKKFYILRFLAQMCRVFPHLTYLFLEVNLAQILLAEVEKCTEARNIETILGEILTPLLQIDISTDKHAFCAKLHLKRTLISHAVACFAETKSKSSLVLVKAAIPPTQVQLHQYNFDQSIEHLVLETPLLP